MNATLSPPGYDIKDYGDVSFTAPHHLSSGDDGMQGTKNFAAVRGFNEALGMAVADILDSGRVCITLGGDHSVAIGWGC